MNDITNKLDNLLSIRKDIINEISNNIDIIKSKVCPDNIKYATDFDGLGVFSPSLVIDKITGGYKKGRILKNPPKSPKYVKCYYDEKGEILFFEKYNEFGLDLTCYFYRIENVLWVAPFIGDGYKEYPTDVYSMVFDNGKIKDFSYMASNSIWDEVYRYSEDCQTAECHEYYYVPDKKENQLLEMKINILLEKDKVKKLECFEMIDGMEKLIYKWGFFG